MSRPAITGWSTISPHGRGRKAFLDGTPAGVEVPDFDIQEVLGRKGTRSMNRVTALAVATVGDLLAGTGCDTGGGTGLVLGTTTGSVQSMMDFTRSSLTAARPYQVDPALFPNTVMNCAAGQCAIRHGLSGPNATLAGGRTAGLQALSYTGRLLRSGRAKRVLAGAAEELGPARARLAELTGAGTSAPLTEGCAMLLVEQADVLAPGSAEVLGVRSRMSLDGDPGEALRACADALLGSASLAEEDIWAVSGHPLPGRRHREIEGLPGDAASATAAFQVVSVLAAAECEPGRADRFALVGAVDEGGAVSCLLLRVAGSPS